jgi:maleylpyruvate isomerase
VTSSPRDTLAADLVQVTEATSRLTQRVDGLTDPDLSEPSLLPGWSRAHVVAHVARNAEGMVNLVAWALTGRPTPMYPSAEARSAGIDEAAALPPASLRALLLDSADALGVAISRLLDADDAALWRLLLFGAPPPGTAPDVPAWTLGWARLREVEIHHLDLAAGLAPSDWPESFVDRMVDFLDGRGSAPPVTGARADIVAWRLGRGSFPAVRSTDGSDPGAPPAW